MKNSKLIVLLSSFELSEWKRFGEFLSTPFFNKRKDLINYFQYLDKFAPRFETDSISRETIFNAVYPKQSFNKQALAYLNSYMLKQAERFLIQIRLEKKEYWSNYFLLEELMERKLDKHYRRYLKEIQALVAGKQSINSDYYLYRYQLSDLAKRHFLGQQERRFDENIQFAWDRLDSFYFFNKMKAACEILEWKNIIKADYDMSYITELAAYLKRHQTQLDHLTLIYLKAYFLLLYPTTKDGFIQFVQLISQYKNQIPNSEKKYIYLLSINYCGSQIKKGNDPYYYVEACLNLYVEGIEDRFLFENNYLSPWTFKNVVKLGFNLKRYQWTEQFIQDYYAQLEEEFQADALHFNLADLYYRKKEYQQAQQHLLQVRYSDIFYNLGAKTMLIKIYYETNEEEALLSMLASFTLFLKRNKKITKELRNIYLNFTTFLNRILRIKPAKKDQLMLEIKQTKLVTNRNWLLQIVS